ncbi:MAG: glycosyltransferase family 39 protein [Candidatus Aminicenantes bacterium]|nr:glycosyltransferase family 39 protein [Candidatus Aminicenantes bacterium]
MRNQRRRLLPLLGPLIILALAAVLRVQHIKADPPPLLVHLTNSAGIYFDEAMYCHNARNKLLFGTWMTDDWNPVLYNGILTGIYYGGFKIFGLSIATMKMVNVVFGLLGILFLYLAIRGTLTLPYALGFGFLFAVDFYWTMYNRVGLLENFSTLFFIISYYFAVRAKDKPRTMMFFGICVALAVLSKYLFFYFFFAALAAVAYHAWQDKKWRDLLSFLAGALAVLLVWFIAVFLPLASSFRKIGSGWLDLSWPESIGQFFFNIYRNNMHRYMSLVPLLFIVALLFSAAVLIRLWKRNPPPELPELFVVLWLAGTFLQMAILNYQPLRYYLNIVPALFFAVSLAIKNRPWMRAHAIPIFLIFLALAPLFYRFWVGLVKYPSALFAFNYVGVRFLIYAAILIALWMWLKSGPGFDRIATACIFGVLALSSLTIYYAQFYKKPVYQLQTISNSLRQLPPDSVIMGNEAPRLALETGFRLFPAFEGWFNDRDPFHEQRPSHLLTLDKYWGGEIKWIKRRFPEIAGRLKLLRQFPLWDTTVSLYKVNYPEGY